MTFMHIAENASSIFMTNPKVRLWHFSNRLTCRMMRMEQIAVTTSSGASG